MKTMEKGNSIIRVSEQEAESKLKEGYKYCPKSKWKKKSDKGTKLYDGI